MVYSYIMKILIVTFIILLIPICAKAEQKYNPHTGRWETTSSDGELMYNPHNAQWSYQQRNSDLEYNPHNAQWEYAPPSSQNSINNSTNPHSS